MKSNIGVPFYSSFIPDPDLEWQMSRAEKYCLINTLQTLQPEVSIEIGTYKGGSLQVIQQFSEEVYSIDISQAPKKFLEKKFPLVNYIVADGHLILHELFAKIEKDNKKLEFILVDGDHTYKGVKRDIEAILTYPHKNPITIILHDSFNPGCRKGIRTVNYSNYPAVEYVELDYITGSYWHNDTYREMWGGFGMIRINPDNKNTSIEVTESQKNLFKLTYYGSIHIFKDKLHFLAPIKRFIFKKIGRKNRAEMYDSFD